MIKDITTNSIEANGNECTNYTRSYVIDQKTYKCVQVLIVKQWYMIFVKNTIIFLSKIMDNV